MKRHPVFFWLVAVVAALAIVTAATGLWMPAPAQAIATDVWRTFGPQERWTIGEQEITGRSEFSFEKNFLVTRPESVPELLDFRFQFRLHPLQGADHNFVWNFQDTNNYYQAHFTFTGVTISRFVSGQEVLSRFAPFALQPPQTYDVVLLQEADQLTLRVDGQKILEFQDLTHDQRSRGAVGFKMAAGTIVPAETKFGQVKIEDFAVKMLPVQPLKQTDEAWGALTYDTAYQWSFEPTIHRWGCALTSLVMILHYHQLVTMPDGRMVTPATVNEWLSAQPDGYVGTGLVNWFAATRLTREISEQYAAQGKTRPKLEFLYHGSTDWQTTAEAEIRANRPPIVQVPGHFAALYGFDLHAGDFFIRDPFYAYGTTSEHSAVQSLRLFRPSQTDLSAVVVVHRPSVNVLIKNATGETVSTTWLESMFAGDEYPPAWQFTAVFKPDDGEYEVVVDGEQAEGELQLFTYDQAAQLTSFPLNGSVRVSFAKTGESALMTPTPPEPTPTPTPLPTPLPTPTPSPELSFSWQPFLEALTAAHAAQELTDAQFTRLFTLATWGAQAAETTWPRYKNYFHTIFDFYENEIDVVVADELVLLLQ